MKKYHTIYKVTCFTTGKYYIGKHSTNNLDDNYLGSGLEIKESIKEYGKENHYKEILSIHKTSEESLLEEASLVTWDLIESDLNIMNRIPGGKGGTVGFKHSEEVRKKISESKKGLSPSEETRIKISESLKGKTHSEKARRKMSEAQKGELNHFFGKTHSEKAKRKISEAQKGKVIQDETRRKMSESKKDKKLSEEHRRNLSESLKKYVITEEHKENIRKAMENNCPRLGKKHSEDTKKRLSKAIKGKIHITNGIKNRMILLSSGIPEGWKRGRTINNNK